MSIEVRRVEKRFGKYQALAGVSLRVEEGELVALLGPSGSGKTSLLRVIAGLEAPDTGSVLFSGRDATGAAPRDRGVGFVFQHYALFRHSTVFENVAFGLRVLPRRARPDEARISARVHELLGLVQLDGMADRYPSQLSGGQRQRVALARALAVEPRVLLLDEPFGALDAKVRKGLRRWLRRLHDDLHVTSVFVTHDQEEALEVADRVVVMNEGRVEQVGTPDEVYQSPATAFVLEFLGQANVLRGRVRGGRACFGAIEVDAPEVQGAPEGPAVGYVRPHDLALARDGEAGSSLTAIVREVRVLGPLVRVELEEAGTGAPLEAEAHRHELDALGLAEGDRVFVRPRRWQVFATRERGA